MKTRWGLIGCGGISELFATCLMDIEDATITAIASKSPEKLKSFESRFGNPKPYDDYLQLVQDEGVDIVYIGTTHNFHLEHTLLALEHGKHVVCEKPISLNADFTRRMIDKAKERNLFLMEAVWTRFLPAILKLQEVIQDGIIGDVHMVNADFSIIRPFDPEHRLYNPKLGGGALLDLGIYPLTFAQLVYQELPESFQTVATIGKTGVDESSSYLLDFQNGRTAVLSSSCRSASPHLGIVIGSKGYITVPDFYHPHSFTVHQTDYTNLKWDSTNNETFNMPYDSFGYGHEAREAMRCVQEGLTESPMMPLSLSLKMMKLMDSMRSNWGVRYPDES